MTTDIPSAKDESTLSDPVVETWLRDEVAPVFDAMKADPTRALKAEDVFTEIAARHARRLRLRQD